MTDTEKLLMFGFLGLIAWELWPKKTTAPTGLGLQPVDTMSNTPPWIQQLSQVEQQEFIQEIKEGDTFENLLSIPQGPGGTSNYNYDNVQPINFFNPTRGLLSLCSQQPQPPTLIWNMFK